MRGWLRGHPVWWDGLRWLYEDGVPVELEERPCPKCGETAEKGGPDPCLGMIPGANGACCGHGVHLGYVNWPGISVRQDEWVLGAHVRD